MASFVAAQAQAEAIKAARRVGIENTTERDRAYFLRLARRW